MANLLGYGAYISPKKPKIKRSKSNASFNKKDK
jgi:hypothetical protein